MGSRRPAAHRLPRWFADLLPEDGPLLRFLASELKLNPRDEPGLLAALGHDLPGALIITSPETSQATSHRRLEQPVEGPGAAEQPTPNVRFSVAGVQLKLSMTHDAGELRLAGKGGWGNSYVKFPGHYSHIPENEFTMMRLAKAAGITVPKVQLVDGNALGIVPGIFERHRSSKLFVIERFDRTTSGPVQIEDFNQVIDNWPDQKYGGASYEALGRLILNICGEPDFLEYIRRLTFNIAIGNNDAHLKNWSLWYPDRVTARLSPAYDLVSTVVYPELDGSLALKLGRRRQIRQIHLSTFRRLAGHVGSSEDQVSDCVTQMLDTIRQVEDDLRGELPVPPEWWDTIDRYRRTVPLLAGR